MSSKSIGIAVLGCGYWGRKLVEEYLALSRKTEDLHLICVVDADTRKLKAVSDEFGLPRTMLETDSNKVLQLDAVQAVHVALPTELHYQFGMAALRSRKHVLLEKPMALTPGEAIKLARTAEQESLVLNVGHIFRFNNAVIEARKLIDGGAIGKPLYYNLHWEMLAEPPEGRDIIFDMGPHPTDSLNYISNEWPTHVLAIGRSFVRRKPALEEAAQAFAEFEGGSFAQIGMSWLYSGPRRRQISVAGDRGALEVDAVSQKIVVHIRGNSKNYPVEANNSLQAMIAHFLDCILGRGTPKNSALVGAITVSVLSAMRESMKTRQFVNVLGS